MTKDFAKPSTTRKAASKKKKPVPKRPESKATPAPQKSRAKLIAVLLVLLLGFGYGLYVLQGIPPTLENMESQSKTQEVTKASPPATNEQKESENDNIKRFKFYDLLPESEVVAPKVEAYRYKEKNLSDDVYYIIQTGSFRSAQDAERQKAMIAFQGLKADIQTVQNAEGSTWHRVVTGPFYNRSEMNSALDKLVAIQIEPLVKKLKH